jgi:DNA-binding winged helix-turn-helix (wHTH) protein
MDSATELPPDVDTSGVCPPLKRFVKITDCCIDVTQGIVFKDGKQIRLSTTCHNILLFLVSKQGDLVTRQELWSRFWPHVPPDAAKSRLTSRVNDAITQIRKCFSGADPIETIRGKGYCLNSPVSFLDLIELPVSALGTSTSRNSHNEGPQETPSSPAPSTRRFRPSQLSEIQLAVLWGGSIVLGILLGFATTALWWIRLHGAIRT